MRLTIVSDDNAVGIDGEFFSGLNLSALDKTIHAVQWYGEYGEIEYKTKLENNILLKPANVLIKDIISFQFAIDVWNLSKLESIAAKQLNNLLDEKSQN